VESPGGKEKPIMVAIRTAVVLSVAAGLALTAACSRVLWVIAVLGAASGQRRATMTQLS
jgi:hypothetical protein